MKLLRVGPPGAERPALLDESGLLRDLSAEIRDVEPETLSPPSLARLAAIERSSLPLLPAGQRLGPPLARAGKIVCIGLNYADHARETGQAIPEEPIIFLKAPDTLVGPADDILIPRGSVKTDYEVELALIIGSEARYLDSADEAADCIAGYAVSNDVSERTFQLERGGQWTKGKSCETFNPLGPWLVTSDEIDDPQSLGVSCTVNGEIRQRSSTAEMVFGAHALVHYLSHFMVLRPGDIVNTGTPAGVALGRQGEPYLRPGDVVEVTIDGLGRQRGTCGQA